MLSVVKICSSVIEADTEEECNLLVSKKIKKLSEIKLFDREKKFVFDVNWVDKSYLFKAVITAYYLFDMKEVDDQHCKICREVHDLFYCNPNYNCFECKFYAYKERAIRKEKDMRSAGKEIVKTEFAKKNEKK